MGDIHECLAWSLVVSTAEQEIDGWSMTIKSTLHRYKALETKLARASAI